MDMARELNCSRRDWQDVSSRYEVPEESLRILIKMSGSGKMTNLPGKIILASIFAEKTIEINMRRLLPTASHRSEVWEGRMLKSEESRILMSELAGRVTPLSRALAVYLPIALVIATMTVPAQLLPHEVLIVNSDQIVLWEDAENGLDDWGIETWPDTSYLDSVGVLSNRTELYYQQNFWPITSHFYIFMISLGGNPGRACALSPTYDIGMVTKYVIALDFQVPIVDNGRFYVVSDGKVKIWIDGGTQLAVSDGDSGLVNVHMLEHSHYYRFESRVDLEEGKFAFYIDGIFMGDFDTTSNPRQDRLTIGDCWDSSSTYGQAHWDSILVSVVNDLSWFDSFEDDDISDWTRVVTDAPLHGYPSGSVSTHQIANPWGNYVLGIDFEGEYSVALARSPMYYVNHTRNYGVSFNFMIPRVDNTFFTVASDGRIWLAIESGTELVAIENETASWPIASLEAGVWYTVICKAWFQEFAYDVILDGDFKGAFNFSAGRFDDPSDPDPPFDPLRPLSPYMLLLGGNGTSVSDKGTAYWDNILIQQDSDYDYLGDEEELLLGTDPLNDDSDQDGLIDGLEMGVWRIDADPSTTTDPTDADTDDDGLPDGFIDFDEDQEADLGEFEDANMNGRREGDDATDSNSDWNYEFRLGETDPDAFDTDEDWLSDGLEIGLAYPLWYSSWQEWFNDLPNAHTGPSFAPDGDAGATVTDPLDFDADDDLLPDGWRDADEDLAKDDCETEDENLDGVVDSEETDPNLSDTDTDNLDDYVETCEEATCPYDDDSDDDDLPDGWEMAYGFDPVDLQNPDTWLNPDLDGLTNKDEYDIGTDPTSKDTDQDFIEDQDDLNPLTYNINEVMDNVFFPDVIVVSESLNVQVAVRYMGYPHAEPTIELSQMTSAPVATVGDKLFIWTDTSVSFEAIVKIGYSGDNPLDNNGRETDEKHLLPYWYRGEEPDGEWTLPINPWLGQEAWRDTLNNYVWTKTRELGNFTIADSTQNDVGGDESSDGEQLNVADYDPIITTLCDSDDFNDCIVPDGDLNGDEQPDGVNEKGSWELVYGESGDQTLYARIWLEEGAREVVLVDTDPGSESPRLTLEGLYVWDDGAFSSFDGGTTGGFWSDEIEGDTYLAQSFSSGQGRDLGAVEFYVFAINTVEECFLAEIRSSDQNGKPKTSHWIQSDCFTDEEIPHTPMIMQWTRWTIEEEFIMTSANPYWIVLYCTDCPLGDSNAEWMGYHEDYYSGGKVAQSENAGIDWTLYDDDDFWFKVFEKSRPDYPSLNVKSSESDTSVDWNYPAEAFEGPDTALAFDDDLGTFLDDHQSTCDESGCTATEGYVMVPFVFHSGSLGELDVSDIHMQIEAEIDDPGDILPLDSEPDGGDGLSDALENAYGSDPDDKDTDDDGIPDGAEAYFHLDIDGDGLIGLLDPDSDNDGLWDGWKDCGTDGVCPGDPGYSAPDGDGSEGNLIWDDGEEKGEWNYGSSPLSEDSDGDGLYDGDEISASNSYVTKAYNFEVDGDKWENKGVWGHWIIDDSNAHSRYHSWKRLDDPNHVQILQSPDIEIPLMVDAELRFWHIIDTSPGAMRIVRIYYDGGLRYDLKDGFDDAGSWTEEVLDLSGFVGKTIRIEFFAYEGDFGDVWSVDDVSIRGKPSPTEFDTDQDGWSDWLETEVFTMNPSGIDGDSDGLTDPYDNRPLVEDNAPNITFTNPGEPYGQSSYVVNFEVEESSTWWISKCEAHYDMQGFGPDRHRQGSCGYDERTGMAEAIFPREPANGVMVFPEWYLIEVVDEHQNGMSVKVTLDRYHPVARELEGNWFVAGVGFVTIGDVVIGDEIIFFLIVAAIVLATAWLVAEVIDHQIQIELPETLDNWEDIEKYGYYHLVNELYNMEFPVEITIDMWKHICDQAENPKLLETERFDHAFIRDNKHCLEMLKDAPDKIFFRYGALDPHPDHKFDAWMYAGEYCGYVLVAIWDVTFKGVTAYATTTPPGGQGILGWKYVLEETGYTKWDPPNTTPSPQGYIVYK